MCYDASLLSKINIQTDLTDFTTFFRVSNHENNKIIKGIEKKMKGTHSENEERIGFT